MSNNLDSLRAELAKRECDGFISFNASHNQFLTGFRGSTSTVIVTASEAQFLSDFRYTEQAGEQVAAEFSREEVRGALPVRAGEHIADLGIGRLGFDPVVTSCAQLNGITKSFDGETAPLNGMMSGLRAVKTVAEVAAIEAASRLAEGVVSEILEDLRPGISELELSARIEYEFKCRGASGTSFDTIALFGSRSSLVHGQPSSRALEDGDIVLVDFGCRLDGYCSDLTRTCVFGRIPEPWFEEIYEITLSAQEAAIAAARPGIRASELDSIARTIISDAGYGEYFGHGLGHGVGIEVHEAPKMGAESVDTLSENMILTIEPGIYLPGRGGVRIEDLAVVTSDGLRLLSTMPKTLRMIN